MGQVGSTRSAMRQSPNELDAARVRSGEAWSVPFEAIIEMGAVDDFELHVSDRRRAVLQPLGSQWRLQDPLESFVAMEVAVAVLLS